MKIRILIADDHKLFRQGLIGLMSTHDEFIEVVGEAESGQETIYLAEALRPDVILMDIYMPGGDGLQALRTIHQRFPKIAVVMLTSSENDKHLYESIRMGASGYLLKSLDASELFDLIEGVMHGEAAITRTMAAQLLKGIANQSQSLGESVEELTEREVDVLKLVAKGATNAQIADGLYISVNTVKSHLKNILQKLHVENRTQAAAYAVKSGLVAMQISGSSNDTTLLGDL